MTNMQRGFNGCLMLVLLITQIVPSGIIQKSRYQRLQSRLLTQHWLEHFKKLKKKKKASHSWIPPPLLALTSLQQWPAVIHHVPLCSLLCLGQPRNSCHHLISAFFYFASPLQHLDRLNYNWVGLCYEQTPNEQRIKKRKKKHHIQCFQQINKLADDLIKKKLVISCSPYCRHKWHFPQSSSFRAVCIC